MPAHKQSFYDPVPPPPRAYTPRSKWSKFIPSWLYKPQPSVSPQTAPSPPVATSSPPQVPAPSPPVATSSPPRVPTPSPVATSFPPRVPTIYVHPSLSYDPIDPMKPRIQWDIISPPEHAREFSGKHRLRLRPLKLSDEAMYATEGGDITDIWIESDNPHLKSWIILWGPIRLLRIPTQPKFTIGDVLVAIREYLSVPLTTAEVARLFEGDRNQPGQPIALVLAKARTMRERDEKEWGMRGAFHGGEEFRRSDVLGPYRRFQGLRSDGTGKVYLGILPGQIPR